MNKYSFLQIDLDDNQWIRPRQYDHYYDIKPSEIFIKAIDNIEKYLGQFPLTLFVVGMDMEVDEKINRIKKLLDNHPNIEVANHSFSHFNNFATLSNDEKEKEILESDKAIKTALGLKKIYGFRSPGYIYNKSIIEILKRNEYLYDSSLFPSFWGPVLRALNRMISKVPGKDNFGHFRYGFLPNEPVLLDNEKDLFEINVSVCPYVRCPIHYSIIKSKRIYSLLALLIRTTGYLNCIFHLDDFVDINIEKLQYVINLVTSQRKVILSKDIESVYKGDVKR